jgi:hypothetical protein
MTEIAITDHSDEAMNMLTKKYKVSVNSFRTQLKFWDNIHNNVNVIF